MKAQRRTRVSAEQPAAFSEVEQLAAFVTSASIEDLSDEAIKQLKIRVLDSLGVAIGALDAEPIHMIRRQLIDFGGNSLATLIGGGLTSPDRAAFYNGALVRYLDFMDSYVAPGETYHPSDNLGAVLAAAEYAHATGAEFLTALAVAYEVQARLSEAAPVRAKGFDHTTLGSYAVAAGVAKALRLDVLKTANAIAMSGTANNALRVTRTGALSHWKGLAYPNTAFSATYLTFLAMRGITGPREVFEGNKGFKETIAGPFAIDWRAKGFGGITRSIVKRYNAEIHSQSAIEAVLELRAQHGLAGANIHSVEVETFQVAYDIIGGGEEGSKTNIRTKEDADHSLPYMIAVALLDGDVMPEQYSPERIVAEDVQGLLKRVKITPKPSLSARFPRELPARVSIILTDGRRLTAEKSDYEGFYTRPMPWPQVQRKFQRIASRFMSSEVMELIAYAIARLEYLDISALTKLLTKVHGGVT